MSVCAGTRARTGTFQAPQLPVVTCAAMHRKTGGLGTHGRNGVRSNRTAFIVKLPKSGSATFVRELNIWSCDMFGLPQIWWSERGHGLLAATGAGAGLFLVLRDPTQHVLSMYDHCQFGHGQQSHHHNSTGLHEWLSDWLSAPNEQRIWPKTPSPCDYYPRNFQTGSLLQAQLGAVPDHGATWHEMDADQKGALEHALCVVRSARFVGVTHRMQESLCVASYVLHGRLPGDGRCSCSKTQTAVRSITHRKQNVSKRTALDEGTAKLLSRLTESDAVVYARALSRFYADVRRVERVTATRIWCDRF